MARASRCGCRAFSRCHAEASLISGMADALAGFSHPVHRIPRAKWSVGMAIPLSRASQEKASFDAGSPSSKFKDGAPRRGIRPGNNRSRSWPCDRSPVFAWQGP